MTPTIPARDWELTCHECDGSGHVYVKRQVAERKTDIQEFKEECECCEGRGFVFAFQDIPGIEEYVKTCRPASSAPGVSTVEDAQAVAWMEPGIDVPVTNEYRNKTPLRQAKYCVPLYKHAPVNAPAAGNALDVDALANAIRSIDGKHTMGAGALAEALMPLIQKASPAALNGDTERLDFMVTHHAWVGWSKDRECCAVYRRDDEGYTEPMTGWTPSYLTPREAIDAAIAAQRKGDA